MTSDHPMLEGRRLARIKAVEPLDGFAVHLQFTDGTEKTVDLDRYIRGPIFQPLRDDPALFRAVAVDPELGTIVWPNGADIDPDVLRYDLTPAEWEDEGLGEARPEHQPIRQELHQSMTEAESPHPGQPQPK